MMFLKKKILMTFLGYQRAVDEVIEQLALVVVIARRRSTVIDFLQQSAPMRGKQHSPIRSHY